MYNVSGPCLHYIGLDMDNGTFAIVTGCKYEWLALGLVTINKRLHGNTIPLPGSYTG